MLLDGHGARRPARRLWAASSHLLAKLTEGPTGYDFERVARWPRRAGADLRETELVLVPLNVGNQHWTLAAIEPRLRVVHYFDSLGPARRLRVRIDVDGAGAGGADPLAHYGPACRALARWARDELRARGGAAAGAGAESEGGGGEWTVLVHAASEVPQQRNTVDCGVFCIEMGRALAEGRAWGFGQSDVSFLRRQLALQVAQAGPTGEGLAGCAR